MKHLLTALFLIPLLASAQTPDPYLSVAYLGYQNGAHVFQMTNKQTCAADIAIQYTNFTPTAINPNTKNYFGATTIPSGVSTFKVTGSSNATFSSFKMMAQTICSWKGNATWITPLNAQASLPVKFKSVTYEVLEDGKIKVKFVTEQQMNIKDYKIDIELDGQPAKTYVILFPYELEANKTYTALVTLKTPFL